MAVRKTKALIWINYNCSIQTLKSSGAGKWMLEPDAVRVQEKPLARRKAFALSRVLGRRAIKPVARHGMADAGEVHADLVGTAGADPHFQKGEAGEPPKDMVFGPGRAAAAQPCSHARAMPRIACDGLFDSAAIRLYIAMDQRQVSLLHPAAGEQCSQCAMRGVVLGYQNHATGEPVQAMHDSGPQIAAQRGERLKAAEQRVDQRAAMHSGSGVYHHARRLVDGDQVLVLVQHAQWDRFRFGAQGRQLVGLHVDAVTQAQYAGGSRRHAVYQHPFALDPILQAGAAELGEALMQRLIQTLAGMFVGGRELHDGDPRQICSASRGGQWPRSCRCPR